MNPSSYSDLPFFLPTFYHFSISFSFVCLVLGLDIAALRLPIFFPTLPPHPLCVPDFGAQCYSTEALGLQWCAARVCSTAALTWGALRCWIQGGLGENPPLSPFLPIFPLLLPLAPAAPVFQPLLLPFPHPPPHSPLSLLLLFLMMIPPHSFSFLLACLVCLHVCKTQLRVVFPSLG